MPQVTERKRAVFYVDEQDGIPVCCICKVQIGEGEDHCFNCALYESEEEIVALKKKVASSRYTYIENMIADLEILFAEKAEDQK